MEIRRITHSPASRLGIGAFLAAWLWCQVAAAQTGTRNQVTTTFDAYGNVRPFYRARYSVGLFTSEQERDAFRAYQTRRRRVDRRRGVFALPGDYFATTLSRAQPQWATPPASPVPTIALSPRRHRELGRYGGFDRHPDRAEAAGVSVLFARRHALISATSLNAPVYRAMINTGPAFGVRAATARAPFVGREEGEAAEPTAHLDQRLREGVELDHQRVRADGWAWFREGQYRRAARAFESATFLEPSDVESRVGELFCYLSVEATRTAGAVLGELTRRDVNPFLAHLNLTEAYGNAAEAHQVRLRLRLQAYTGGDNPHLRALYALALWYLGERDEAILVATNLARDFPSRGYVDWPAKMRTMWRRGE
ncbi:MAG: hypothetical protein WBE26_04100 [Phycisphaerae bacterium]